jgi:arginase
MGGDHSLALGSAAGAAAFAERQGRPLFLLCGWMRIPISTRR